MRSIPIVLLLAFLLLAVPAAPATADRPTNPSTDPPAAPATAAGLRIAELLANPDAAQGQREFVELWNPTNSSIDLVGWTLHDAPTASGSTNAFTFATGRLAPNGRIAVWSNSTASGTPDARGPSWSTSTGKTVWNDGGDAVTLSDPADAVVDWFAFGTSAMAPPAGFEGRAKPAAAPRGQSLALDGSWAPAIPSPGLAPGTVGAVATAQVVNVGPTAAIMGLPGTARPGQAVEVGLAIADGNGVADIAAWSLRVNNATVAQGAGSSLPSTFRAVAPAVSGPWSFALSATDAGGLAASAAAVVQVRDPRLSLQLPSGVLRFPDLRPGDANVTALDWATLRNEGTGEARPLLDVSSFTGPATMAIDGRLSIGVRTGGGANGTATPAAPATTWIAYGGPLTPLPPLAPGASLAFTLRLDRVPAPLAAGSYGTTFAVVAA